MSRVPSWSQLRDDLGELHAAALAAADPALAVAAALRLERDRLVVGERPLPMAAGARIWAIALGKASAGMARAALGALGPRLAGGLIAHPHGLDPGSDWPGSVRTIAAGHPLPDEGSLRAGAAALELLRSLRPPDILLVLISGGGSALCESLRPGVTLDDLRELTGALQRQGADIVELNVVRRALSRLKGGGLARTAGPLDVVTLLLSDVPGDRLETIASGPTVVSPTRATEALAVIDRLGLTGRFAVLAERLRASEAGSAEARDAGERIAQVVGSNRIAASALCAQAEARGFRTLLLTDRMQGEAREVGRCLGGIARGMCERELPLAPPACLVLGGETTVTVAGHGRGGRNLELAAGAALALEGCAGAAVFSFATDGVDGTSRAAGAVATGDTVGRATALGLSIHRALAESATESLFEPLGDLWVTGPTGTNVNDLAVLLAYP